MYDLIIFGGQSNMQGQTEGNPNDMPVANAKEYLLLSDSFKELKNPVGEDIGELLLASHMGGGSLVPYFAQEYVKGTGRSVVAVHAAKGATTIKQWLKNTAEGGERYKKAVEKMLAAKTKILAEGGKIGNILYVWLQGESDALAKTSGEEYREMLLRFKNDLKQDVGIDKFGIIEVGYFSYVCEMDNALDEAIQSAQVSLCNSDSDFVYLTGKAKELSLKQDWLNPEAPGHFSNKAMREIGESAGMAASKIKF